MEFQFLEKYANEAEIPADFRGLYSKDEASGEMIRRSDDPGITAAIAAIGGLNGALRAARGEAKALKGSQVDLSVLKDFGDNPDAILQAVTSQIEELQGQVQGGEQAKVDVSKVREELAQAHAMELKGRDERNDALKRQLHELLVDQAARSAIGDSAINADLLLPFINRQVKALEEDGKFKVVVVDGEGTRRYSGTTGLEMTIPELVETMKGDSQYQPLFKSQAPEGGGTPAPGQRKAVPANMPQPEKSSVDKISAGLAARGVKG